MNQEQIKEIMRLGELWAQRAWNGGKGDEDEITKIVPMRANLEAYLRTLRTDPPFQQRVQPWMLACFGEKIAADKAERNHRFLEEALELVQATGCTVGEAHQLVDYVYGRPVGEPVQEVGGVMVTLAALCLAHGMDMHSAAETELARIWTKVEQIRAKQAAKPKHSPLPEFVEMAESVNAEMLEALKAVRESVSDGLETTGICELEWSIEDKKRLGRIDAAIYRVESAVETSAKVSPFADQQIIDYVKGVYAFLESTSPAGFADEAFRFLPFATRAQQLFADAIQGDELGKCMGSEGKDSKNRERHAKKGRCAMDMIPVKQEANEQPRNILLKVAGKSFRCSCGCNVFQKLDPDNENEYTCNACHATYEAGGA